MKRQKYKGNTIQTIKPLFLPADLCCVLLQKCSYYRNMKCCNFSLKDRNHKKITR